MQKHHLGALVKLSSSQDLSRQLRNQKIDSEVTIAGLSIYFIHFIYFVHVEITNLQIVPPCFESPFPKRKSNFIATIQIFVILYLLVSYHIKFVKNIKRGKLFPSANIKQ